MDPVRGLMKNGMKIAPIVLSVCKSLLKIATRQWARMTQIDVLFSGREKPLLLMYEQIVHTRQEKQKHTSFIPVSLCQWCQKQDKNVRFPQRRCSEDWKPASRWGHIIKRGSSAPLPHSPGGGLACIASPLSCPPSAGTGYDRCCPCSQVKCTCRVTENFWGFCTVSRDVVHNWGYTTRVKLTPCHRGYSRAQIMSSRKTRCHGTSSPVEDKLKTTLS